MAVAEGTTGRPIGSCGRCEDGNGARDNIALPAWLADVKAKPEFKEVLLPRKKHNFVTGALMDCHDLFELYRVFRKDKEEAGQHEMLAVVQFGARMCGHDGIVHGGATATVFDDLFGWLFEYSEDKAFTAMLTTNYRRPIKVQEPVLFHLVIDKREGRKLHASATASAGPGGDVYATSETLYILARKDA